MGGLGSGRTEFDYPNSKTTVEECENISSTDWYNRGLIENGLRRKQFTVTVEDKKIDYEIKIDWVECNFGGKRPYFICPEKNCGERVEKLYRPRYRKYFLCRHCWNLTYKRCNISGNQARIKGHKLIKIREKLRKKAKSEDYNIGPEIYKPKGMHWDTYLKIEEKYYELMDQAINLYKKDMEDTKERMENLLDREQQ